MTPHTLLEATTAAGNSLPIQCTQSRPHIHFMVPGIAAADDDAKIQISVDGGSTWNDYYIDDALQIISMGTGKRNTGRVVTAYGLYRVVKPSTTGAASVVAMGLT